MKFTCKKCGSTEYAIKSRPNGTGTATSIAFMPNSNYTSEIHKDVKIRGLKGKKEMKNEKILVELGEVIEMRDAEDLPTVEVNIKVNLDGIFLTEAMREAISKAFDSNQLFWHEVADIFLGDIGKVYLGFSRRLKEWQTYKHRG